MNINPFITKITSALPPLFFSKPRSKDASRGVPAGPNQEQWDWKMFQHLDKDKVYV